MTPESAGHQLVMPGKTETIGGGTATRASNVANKIGISSWFGMVLTMTIAGCLSKAGDLHEGDILKLVEENQVEEF